MVVASWRKSSYSGNNGGDCIETASVAGAVLIRDTKDHGAGPVLGFPPAAWAAFTAALKG
jgi:hypothetical protein